MVKLQSSYIFLLNPYKKEKTKTHQDNVISIYIPKKVNNYITDSFSVVEIGDSHTLFRKDYSLKDTDILHDCQGTFIVNNVVDNAYLDITVSSNDDATAIACLEIIQDRLQKSGVQNEYTMIISYDAISEYYCNQIYPKLNRLERNLRKLLFNTYVVNFGRNYYQATIGQELQNKIKSVIQAKGSTEEREISRLQNFFYSLEFSDIQNLLFKPNWTEADNKEKEDFLSQNEDLSKLSDSDLRNAFSRSVPKSDWERFFSAKIDDFDAKGAIEAIRKQRNQIAHCKFFYRQDFDDCCKVISDLDSAIISAIRITEEKDFWEKNWDTVRESMALARKKFDEVQTKFFGAIQQMNTMLEPLQNLTRGFREVWEQYHLSALAQAQDMAIFDLDSFDDSVSDNDSNEKGE